MSKYFKLSEMYYSDTAIANKIDNQPDSRITAHLNVLCEFLDGIREEWGSPIRVNSGYRCKALNDILNGSKTSAHMLGFAADLWPMNGKFEEFKEFILKYLEDKKYDQCIIEKNSKGSQWIHLGLYNQKGEQRCSHFNLNVD